MARRLRPRDSLLWPIVLLVLFVLALMLAGFTVLGLQATGATTDMALQERLLIAEITGERMDEHLERTAATLQAVVGGSTLDPDKPDLELNAQSLRNIRESVGDLVLYIALVDRRGIVVASDPHFEGVVGKDISTGNCTRKIMAGSDPLVTKVFAIAERESLSSAAVMIGLPGADGVVDGLIFAALNLGDPSIMHILKPVVLGETAFAEIVDENGVILATTRPGRLWQQADHAGQFESLIRGKQSMVGTCHQCHAQESTKGRQEDLVAFAPLGGAPWGVALRQSQDEVMATTRFLENRLAALGAGVFVLAILCAGLVTSSMVRPLQTLTTASERIAEGDLDNPVPVVGKAEIQVLARSLEAMRRKLKGFHEEIRSWNQELETRVEVRTAELKATERGRRELMRQLVVTQEETRRALARELHDETSQAITALAVGLETVLEAPAATPAEVKSRLLPLRSLAGQTLQEVRHIILDLRPAILDDLGLVPAIDWYAESRLSERGTRILLETVGTERALPSDLEIVVFRTAQEAINNIARHAEAGAVHITVLFDDATVALDVEDDGCGFASGKPAAWHGGNVSTGLGGMRERVGLFGGTVRVESEPGQGTHLTVTVPLNGGGKVGEDPRPVG